ncbi:MAG: hypothetical protein K2G30_06425, partial [Muribaculaceae bacterium]|nr:hypothetical protein [Muribaculaceae bacterium]
PNLMAYLEHLEQGVSAAENDSESEKARLNACIITSLRTDTGLDRGFLSDRWGRSALAELMRTADGFIASGRLEEAGEHIRIPEKEWLTADSILRELIQ